MAYSKHNKQDPNTVKRTVPAQPFFQPKLSINQPNDVYEQEADAVADKVMRMPGGNGPTKQTFFNPAVGKSRHSGAEEKVQRKENSQAGAQGSDQLDSYVGSLNSSGQSLSASNRRFFEPGFGHDFANVKIHTDAAAAKSAQSVNALAYTSGNHIVFNSGQYAPETGSGKKLLAHELTHVVQQSGRAKTSVQRQAAPPGPVKPAGCAIHFVKNKAEFTDVKEFDSCMHVIKDQLNSGADKQVVLRGFASAEGTAEHNMDLSRRRAEMVFSLLHIDNIDISRVAIEAHGADNTYPTKEENRRVEISINDNVRGDTEKQAVKIQPPPPHDKLTDPPNVPQEPTLSEAKQKGIKLPRQLLERMNVTEQAEKMTDAQRRQWYIDKLGPYEAQVRESAANNKVPVQLLAVVIFNELSDIKIKDLVQSELSVGKGSLGVAQIQISTVIKDNLFDDITADESKSAYYEMVTAQQYSAVGKVLARMLENEEEGKKLAVNKRLQVPQYAIEAAAKEIRILLDRMLDKPDGKWQSERGFVHKGPDVPRNVQAIYDDIKGANQMEKERNLAALVTGAYNSPAIITAKDPSEENIPNAVNHGINSKSISDDLFMFKLFRP